MAKVGVIGIGKISIAKRLQPNFNLPSDNACTFHHLVESKMSPTSNKNHVHLFALNKHLTIYRQNHSS